MPTASTSIVIGRPVADVFEVLADVTRTPEWHPAAVEEWWTSERPPGVGSTRRAVSRSMGVTSENEAVVTAYEPGRALGLRSTESPMPFEIDLSFSEVEHGTEVVWVVSMAGAGWRRPVARLALAAFMRQLDTGLARLRSLMESGRL